MHREKPSGWGVLTLVIAGWIALFHLAPTANACVYATDIQINGGFTTITNGSNAVITYRLNQPAGAVTVNILSGTNSVASCKGGTNMGLNTVIWGNTNNAHQAVTGGIYSVSITASASGFSFWTQISVDTNAGMPAYYPLGIDVDKNTNSPYYGRVVMGCAFSGGSATSVPAAAQKDGFYKMNADGSQADEGWYGNASYLVDDAGDAPTAGQMPQSDGFNPYIIRIGNDDRIYWCDNTGMGAIIACDMQAVTNQIVIDDGAYGELGGPNNYTGNPDLSYLNSGIEQFDVTGGSNTATAVWLCDSDVPPNANWGIWMYHLTNGVSDPADTVGTQAVIAGGNSDLTLGSSGGCMIDTNLDIFIAQDLRANGPVNRAMIYTNWNHGTLPPEAAGSNYALGKTSGQVLWQTGAGDASFMGVQDTVINSRSHPTLVALPMTQVGTNSAFGIRVLSATNGFVISVTNGTVQTLTNLDSQDEYTCAAWDAVGNLYAASPSVHVWRVWSPPGTNSATTMAVPKINVPYVFNITGISEAPIAGTGCAAVTISFTAPGTPAPAPSTFQLYSSSNARPPYTVVSNALFTGVSNIYQVVLTNCATQFFLIK